MTSQTLSGKKIGGGTLLLLAAGFTIWAAAFVALYAMQSVGCAYGWQELEILSGVTLQRLQMSAILTIHLGAIALLVRLLHNHRDQFLLRAAYWAALAALGASIFNFAPIFVLSPCT
ncbi:hypothetical protein [Aquamicrobium zhengzhouense]|uniref:Uncharacterized protein n=1 Tax=Aquamicrobium zhengzhouense TaxID=2781738 RepID=A0ABS0SCJ4_9HYPH|nr:hypothetical protein [Aquamicrobium zhengzhouense]MBI1620991.1 hypothetical protein [Aquamicrobium zhengzhouense]